MDYIPTLINALVISAVGLYITNVTKSQFQDVRREISDVKQDLRDFKLEVRAEFSEVRAEFSNVRSEIASLRSDLTQVAIAVGARPRPQTG